MKLKNAGGVKKWITLAAVLIGTLLSLLTFLFVRDVQQELWQQSIRTIQESTQQGLNTLQVQLETEFYALNTVAQRLEESTADQEEALDEGLGNYRRVDQNVVLYLENGESYPLGTEVDSGAAELLLGTEWENGIIDPHISSVTGVNVFDLYVRVTLADGSAGYLLKEYEVASIVDSFSLSFYDDAGFSYIVDVDGNVLIRPPHPNSNKTVQNLFDMLSLSDETLSEFEQSLKDRASGWAVFSYQGEDTVFCYEPLKLQSDWYLFSIIPKNVVDAQTNHILMNSLLLIGSILLGIALLVSCYLRYARRTNRRLRRQTDYIGHLYNAVPEGIALVSVGRPYCLLQLNREGLRMLDYPEDAPNDAPHGKSLQELLHPDDYEIIAGAFADTVSHGRKNSFEVRVLKADGGFFWAAGIVEKTLDEAGDPILINTFHDITAEKLADEEAEKEMLQERIMLVGAISSVYPLIISLNLSRDTLKFVYVQPGLMLRMGKQRSYSQLFEEMKPSIHPDGRREYEQRLTPDYLCRVLGREKKEVFLEAKQLLEDGQYHWTSTQIIHVENPYSEDQLAILISRRIDEQRYEEEQQKQMLQSALDNAKAASLAKSQFLSNMSHDIRTPMNAIMGMTAIAGSHLDEPERVKDCLQKIDLSGKHLLSLINDVLDMSKVESGKLTIKQEPFNFAQLVADAVELVRPQAVAGRLKVDMRPAVLKKERVIGDSLRISQVLINILSNAVKYTPAGGTITLDIRQEACFRKGYQRYVFRCEDTGVGMEKAFLERLFQPFERSPDSTSSQIAGTGLGMAITKNLVELMDGSIDVESERGKGSVFTVTFPLQVQDAAQEEVPQQWRGVHSLVVDDDPKFCESAVELLGNIGLRAEYITGGEEAVRRIIQENGSADPYRLLILDWKMPDLDGLEVTRQVREQIGGDIPVVILTANDWAEVEEEAKDSGVTAFLSKPFYQSKLCYLLNELSGIKEKPEETVFEGNFDFTNKRILLVEDNAMNREIAKALLEEHNLQVEEAQDGVEALEKIAQSREGAYDLILMDIQMPRMNGYETAKAIRAMDRKDAKKVPIVAMTANAFEEDVHNALQAGMNAHFAKPIDVQAFNQLLHRFLSE